LGWTDKTYANNWIRCKARKYEDSAYTWVPKPTYAEIYLGFDICRNIVSAFCRNLKSQIPNYCRNPKLLPKSQIVAEIPNYFRSDWNDLQKIPFLENCVTIFNLIGNKILCNIMWYNLTNGFQQRFGILATIWDFRQ
jgi:hypothetical protein